MRKKRNIYIPGSGEPHPLSRSRIEAFFGCPLDAFLKIRHGVKDPPSFPFTLNLRVDLNLKSQLDCARATSQVPPVSKEVGLNLSLFVHENIKEWQNNWKGIRYLHPETNLEVYDAIDEVAVSSTGELVLMDFKATSTKSGLNLNDLWRVPIRRQLDIYSWLFRKNGFKVANESLVIFLNAKDGNFSGNTLEFDAKLIRLQIDTSWVEDKLKEIHAILNSESPPQPTPGCALCQHRQEALELGAIAA